jgi:hypothetical protein
MLVMTVHAIIPISETDDRTIALMFFLVLFLADFVFHFGSVFKIMNLE